MDLPEFLLARITEDEAIARTATPGPWRVVINEQWHSRPFVADAQGRAVLDGAAEFAADQWLDAADQDLVHLTRWDPARVLAECAAKRRIVEWHRAWPVLVEEPPRLTEPAGLGTMTFRLTQQIAWSTQEEYRKQFGTEPPTAPILRLLALPYAEHPDYLEEWRPA